LIPDIPREDLRAIVRERGVTDSEFEALYRALSGESNQEIADAFGISEIAVRKRLGEIYRKFEIPGRSPGKLGELKQILLAEYQTPKRGSAKHCDWGEAPSLSEFYGRRSELETLKQWIVDENCRLIAILGMGGMGKTTLVRHFAEQIQDRFEFIIWRSLATAPSLNDLLSKILAKLAPSEELPLTENGKLDTLLSELKQRHCLIVLDETEAILKEKDRYGRYRNGYQNYGDFFKQVGQIAHQSQLLLISQEPPLDLIRLEKSTTTVRSLTLTGLELDAAIKILQQQNCTGKQQNWQYLLETYGGNPLYLKLVASTIQELFQGDVAQFSTLNTIVLPEETIIANLYERLSSLEQEILNYLAAQDERLSLSQIKEYLSNVSFSEIIESMESLQKRSLLEQTENKQTIYFGLQPVIKKYIKRYPLTPNP
jgi:DNA-binding CsgD family transcriptional regulator/AAA+ ATPase superfamily predicted ATPase